MRLHHDIDDFDALPEDAHAEHPCAKSSRASCSPGRNWPAPSAPVQTRGLAPARVPRRRPLVRLKKARGLLCDALRGLDSADAENLATREWRDGARREVDEILVAVLALIRELREVLADSPEDPRG
ncbi:MAG: hypothetical protein U1F77_11650 [Kiritimatiellia bacterium]